MSEQSAAFSAVKALIVADTGTGGLNKTDSSAYVAGGVFQHGDPQRTMDTPRIEIDVLAREISPFGEPGDAGEEPAGVRHADALVTLHLFTKRDLMEQQTAIAARLVNVLWRRTPGTSGDWTFSRLNRVDSRQGPPGENENHYIERYRVLATATPAA